MKKSETKITMEAMAAKIDALTGKVDTLNTKVDTLDGKVDSLSTRLDSTVEKVDELEVTVDKLAIIVSNGFERVEARLTAVEEDLADFKEETAKNFRKVHLKIDTLGESFPSQYAFDELSSRVFLLEESNEAKK